jgi:hypothetical protein
MIVDGALVTPERGKSMFKEFVRRINTDARQHFDIENIEE